MDFVFSKNDRRFSPKFCNLLFQHLRGDSNNIYFGNTEAVELRDAFPNLFENASTKLLLYTTSCRNPFYYSDVAYFPKNAVGVISEDQVRYFLKDYEMLPLWESALENLPDLVAVACEGQCIPTLLKQCIPSTLIVYDSPDLLKDALYVARVDYSDHE